MASHHNNDGIDPNLEVWREPIRGSYPDPAWTTLSGIDALRAILAGKTPWHPLRHLVGAELTEAGIGKATFTMPASPWLLSPQGAIAVGTLAILADGALGCAVHSALPAGTGYTTSELSLRVVRPAQVGGVLTAKGRLIHAGRRVALSEVLIEDGGGRLRCPRQLTLLCVPASIAAICSRAGSTGPGQTRVPHARSVSTACHW